MVVHRPQRPTVIAPETREVPTHIHTDTNVLRLALGVSLRGRAVVSTMMVMMVMVMVDRGIPFGWLLPVLGTVRGVFSCSGFCVCRVLGGFDGNWFGSKSDD